MSRNMPGDLNQRLLAGCVSSLVERGLGLESQVGELEEVVRAVGAGSVLQQNSSRLVGFVECRSLLMECTALLRECRALLMECKALLIWWLVAIGWAKRILRDLLGSWNVGDSWVRGGREFVDDFLCLWYWDESQHARGPIVSFLGLFCKRDLYFWYWDESQHAREPDPADGGGMCVVAGGEGWLWLVSFLKI